MTHRTRLAAPAALAAVLATGLLIPRPALSQEPTPKPYGVGFEGQVYPAGGIFLARGSVRLSTRDRLLGYLGYNLAERGDNGRHADEHGGGPGLGAAWRHHLGPEGTGWYLGARVDLWFLGIDWRDPNRGGTTDITVLQPTAQAGYGWRLGRDWVLEAGASLGAEINVRESGESVGQGAILLLGLGTEYRF